MFQTMRSTKTSIPNLNQKMYPFSKSPLGFSHQQEGLYDLLWSYMQPYASLWYGRVITTSPCVDAMSAPWSHLKDRHLDTFFRLIRSSVVLSSFSCICCKVLDTSSIQPWFKGRGMSWQIHGVIQPKLGNSTSKIRSEASLEPTNMGSSPSKIGNSTASN